MENLALRFMCSFRHLDHHLGENNDDLLMAGQDTLYGGSGNDILEGGTGDDNLYGGAGHDYIWNEGDGVDHITDSDGQGHIEIRQADGSTRIVGGQFIKQNDGSYKSADDQITLRQNGGWSLATQSGATLILDQFKDGDFGLEQKEALPQAPQTTQTRTGDKKPKDHDTDKAGIQYRYDSDGNLIVSEEIETDRRDYLVGAYSRNDRIEGRGGIDFIDADHGSSVNASDDIVLGGDGNDIIWGNEGRDRLEGGTGKDWINGGPDDDWIAANDAQWRAAA